LSTMNVEMHGGGQVVASIVSVENRAITFARLHIFCFQQ
jgi:hypothetical protein